MPADHTPPPAPRPTRLMRAAIAATTAGHHVFPVWPRGKLPAVEDWENAATLDRSLIEAWWAERPWNIGVAVGRARIVVIDLDQARGDAPPPEHAGARGGADVLAHLAAEAGQPDPTDTYTVASPSGGEHRYFVMPTGLELRNSQSRLGWKIDTRGHGGFIVGAGSVRDDGMYWVTRRRPIAALPDWLAVALTPPPPLEPGVPLRLSSGRAGAYLRAILDLETAELAAAPVGTRHEARLKAARTLGRLVAGGELDEQTARDALRVAASTHVGRDTTEREVDRDIEDGLAFGMRLPRSISRREQR